MPNIRAVACLLVVLTSIVLVSAQPGLPEYVVDASWPKALPNDWVIGQVGGMAVEANRRPTINIVPRRIKDTLRNYWSPTTARARTIQRRQGTPGSLGSQSVYKIGQRHLVSKRPPPEGKPCVLKRFQ